MVLTFNNEISKGSVSELIYQLEEFRDSNIDLFFSTEGGSLVYAEVLLHYLNTHCVQNVTLIFTSLIASAGVIMMTDYKGKKLLSEWLDVVVLHAIDRTELGHTRLQKYERNFITKDKKYSSELLKKLTKAFKLTNKEQDRFNKGKDVILEEKDLKRLGIPFLKD